MAIIITGRLLDFMNDPQPDFTQALQPYKVYVSSIGICVQNAHYQKQARERERGTSYRDSNYMGHKETQEELISLGFGPKLI